MAESKKMVGKELAFMKKKGAPKSMIKHEMEEAGVKKMAFGGMGRGSMGRAGARSAASRPSAVPAYGQNAAPTGAKPGGMFKKGGDVKKMAAGGIAASKMGAVKTAAPSRDGVAVKGKTRGKQIVMAGGKGMKKGGYC